MPETIAGRRVPMCCEKSRAGVARWCGLIRKSPRAGEPAIARYISMVRSSPLCSPPAICANWKRRWFPPARSNPRAARLGLSLLQSQTRLGGQLEQHSADLVTGPRAVVPVIASQIIRAIQNLTKDRAAESGHCEKRRGFHLDNYASLSQPQVHLGAGLAVEPVCSPGPAADEIETGLFQGVRDRSHRARMGLHFKRGREVVIGSSLVANRPGRHHQVSDRNR